jgi:multicomponent Na+:H+ antiporter subunit B
MTSIVLRMTARLLLPLLLVFSMFLFWRGHNEPGGGFVAGLVAAAAWALYAIAYDAAEARRALRVEPRLLIGVGLLLALASGFIALVTRQPFLTGRWGYLTLPGLDPVDVGTPVLFDLGVYLAVLGVTLTVVLALAEEE